VQHVINFNMPKDIENYVHRIGRTGRRGKTGVATTFINKQSSETALRDLRQLLIESKQRVPLILQTLGGENSIVDACMYCGGLGHRSDECPKMLRESAAKQLPGKKDFTGGGDW